MLKYLLSLSLVVPFVACVAAPSDEAVRSGSSALGVVGTDPTQPCVCLDGPPPQEVIPSGSTPVSTELCFTICPLQAQSLAIAPGQTNVSLQVEAGVDWPQPAAVTFSVSGLPAGVTAKFVQTIGYVPPVQGIAGAYEFSASPTTVPTTASVTITARSGTASSSYSFELIVGGVCVPDTCMDGQCGAPANGCSGTLSCGGCPTGDFCNPNFKCEATSYAGAPKCAAGTHSCGGGVCAKVCE